MIQLGLLSSTLQQIHWTKIKIFQIGYFFVKIVLCLAFRLFSLIESQTFFKLIHESITA